MRAHPEADRARRRLRIFALGIALAFGALAFVTWWSGRENLREGSRVVREGGPALRIGSIPTTYRAVYRVENRAAADPILITERVWVRRPFASRVESWRDDRRLSVRQSTFGVLTSRSANAEPLNLAAPPSLASGDLRIDAVLEDAVRDKTVLRRERREVFGRECQVYRTGGPVFAGELTRYRAGVGEYTDVCIDDRGLVIEEYWVSRGKLLQRRVAVEVETDVSIDRDMFEIDVPEKEGFDRGAVERLPKGRDEGLWVLDPQPKGFENLGRYAVAISSNALPRLNELQPTLAPLSTTDVYLRGPDLLIVDQDPSLLVATQNEGRQTRPIELEGFEDAVVIFDARMTEVRGRDADGSVVRILGTISPAELQTYARSLVRGGD